VPSKVLQAILPFIFVLFLGCQSNEAFKQQNPKINGVSFVSPAVPIADSLYAMPKNKIHANWLAFMPYAFIDDSSSEILYNQKWQWWGESKEGILIMIDQAQRENYKLMLKPHLWVSHGKFTGDLDFKTDSSWRLFESSYRNYLLEYARLAEKKKLDLFCIGFCIGTELRNFIAKRPDFWMGLITEVKQIYHGKLCYAANWDNYQNVPFWKHLDFVGIDAYFPLSRSLKTNKRELQHRTDSLIKVLKSFSDSLNKPIIFTEYGFTSSPSSTLKPWEHKPSSQVNIKLQKLAYQVFLSSFWNQEFIAGGFLWKWFPNHHKVGGKRHAGFSPQNKAAEKVILKIYKKYN